MTRADEHAGQLSRAREEIQILSRTVSMTEKELAAMRDVARQVDELKRAKAAVEAEAAARTAKAAEDDVRRAAAVAEATATAAEAVAESDELRAKLTELR